MEKSRIYTKTGDKGTTSLVGGARVPKNSLRLDAYGTIDELNSFFGLLRAQEISENDKKNILKIQNELFIVGSILATEKEKYVEKYDFWEKIEFLENQIDIIGSELPPLKSFVIPSDYQPAAVCHICRTICRRAERIICRLSAENFVPEYVLMYMNRLSDYLFVLSRKITVTSHKEDFFA